MREVTFNRTLPAYIDSGSITLQTNNLTDNYVVRNNYFHENRARGALLGAGNGIFENKAIIYQTL